MGWGWGPPHLAGLQSGGEITGRRAGAVSAGRGGRARNKEAEAGERGTSAAPPPAKPVFKPPPPTPKPVPPRLWLSGQLPTSQKYNNSRDTGYGGYHGGGRRGGGPAGAAEKEWAMEGAAVEGGVAVAEDAAAAAAAARTSQRVIMPNTTQNKEKVHLRG